MCCRSLQICVWKTLHWICTYILPPWWKWPPILGVIPIVIHRSLLQLTSLRPFDDPQPRGPVPSPTPMGRPDDGYGTDIENPTASATGYPMGRNCDMIPLSEREPIDHDPPAQLIAQRLLQRDTFQPAGDQLNVLAAIWIQAMVHDWIGHFSDPQKKVTLDKGAQYGCPLASFSFPATKPSDHDPNLYDSFRTQWWDASFVYGQTEEAVRRCRTFVGGKLKTGTHPGLLARDATENIALVGDARNSWVGVALLQELFVCEHNAICDAVARAHADFDDQRLFDTARLVVAAVVAKIHTIDWTCELLKTDTLFLGMNSNWFGFPKALAKLYGCCCGFCKWLPDFFRLTQNKRSENHGVPFCLTEEFVAVYRLHPMLPEGLFDARGNLVPLAQLTARSGDALLAQNPTTTPMAFWDSAIRYPCGGLVLHNYPSALRQLRPTDEDGRELTNDKDRVDLAALDLYRDRERGLLPFNEFRRNLHLKPYKTFHALTGEPSPDSPNAAALRQVYGENGIEKVDLLVGDLAEKRIPGFALPETSFIIFLLMASRRLEADPFLNEYYTEEYYTAEGLDWIENQTSGIRNLLARHYPSLEQVIEQTASNPDKHSGFKPLAPWPNTAGGGGGTTYGSIA